MSPHLSMCQKFTVHKELCTSAPASDITRLTLHPPLHLPLIAAGKGALLFKGSYDHLNFIQIAEGIFPLKVSQP